VQQRGQRKACRPALDVQPADDRGGHEHAACRRPGGGVEGQGRRQRLAAADAERHPEGGQRPDPAPDPRGSGQIEHEVDRPHAEQRREAERQRRPVGGRFAHPGRQAAERRREQQRHQREQGLGTERQAAQQREGGDVVD